jgi:tetratricopeptide (TPR) repeat protein
LKRCIQYLFFLVALLQLAPAWAQKKRDKQQTVKLSEEQRIFVEKEFISGMREKILNNNQAAVGHFLASLKVDPTNAAAHYNLADLYFKNRQIRDAENSIQKAIQLEPSNAWYRKLELQILDASKQYEKAAIAALELSKIENPNGNLLAAAYYFMAAKKYKQAIDVLDKLEKKNGVTEAVIHQKEQIYMAMGQPKKAMAEVQKLIKAFPNNSNYEGMLADLYMNTNQPQKAFEIYQRILKREPNNGLAAFAMADYHLRRKEFDQSVPFIKQGMLSPNTDVKQKMSVLVAILSNRFIENQEDVNLELVEAFIQTHPEEASGYIIKGDLLIQQTKFDEAKEQYEKAVLLEPSAITAWNQLFFIDSERNNHQANLDRSIKAIEVFPNEILFHYYGMISAYQLKQYNKTIDAGLVALELLTADQEDIRKDLLGMIADASHYAKRYDMCDSIYEMVINEWPDNSLALNNYAYFLSLRKVKLDLAATYSKRSLELSPDNPSYLDTYAWIMYNKGDYTEAEKYIRKTLSFSSGSAEVNEHAGDIYYKLGNIEQALSFWKKAKELGSESELLNDKIRDKKLYE